MRRLLESSILAVILLLESAAMSAPPAPEPPEPPAQKEMREQANRLVQEGRLADARDIHLSLWRINGRPTPAFNVGMLSYRIRDFATAAQYLTIWLDLVGSADAPKVPVVSAKDHKEKYERTRVDLQGALKQVEAIRVNVSDPGADVLVDDRRVGVSPLKFPVFVNPGRHRVVAELGGARVEEVVSATAGGERTVRLVLPAAVLRAARTDGAAAASPAPRAKGAAPALPPKPSAWPPPWQTVAVLVAPAALAAGGVVALLVANGASEDRDDAIRGIELQTSQVNQDCPGAGGACNDFTAADGRVKTMTALSIVAFAGAGIATAGAVYTLYPRKQAPVRVGIGGPGVLLAGSF